MSPLSLAWAGFLVSLVYLYRQLDCADPTVLSQWISSDTLWQANIFTDLFVDHFHLSGWVFSIAPCWFPDFAATGIFWLLTQNVILATLLAGFVQIPLLVHGLRLCREAIGFGTSAMQDIFLLVTGSALAIYVGLHPGATYPPFYKLFLPQTHVGSLIAVIYGFGLALLLVRRSREGHPRSWALLGAYTAVCFLAGMSNVLFFTHMLVPLTASLCLGSLLGMLPWKSIPIPLAAGWPAAALGAVINRFSFHASPVSHQGNATLDRILTSQDVFERGAIIRTAAGDPLHVLAVLWAAVCAGFILYTLRALIVGSRERVALRQIMASLFFSCCLLAAVCSILSIVGGGSNGLADFKDYVWSMHYLHPVFLLPVFGFVALISWTVSAAGSPNGRRIAALLVAAAGTLAPVYAIARGPAPQISMASYRPPLVMFMDQLATGRHLEYGYAGYWQARLITLLSTHHLRAYAVDGSMNPLLWVSNQEWYSESMEDHAKRPHIEYVVLDDPLWKLSREAAVRVLGEPAQEFRFQDTRVLLYGAK